MPKRNRPQIGKYWSIKSRKEKVDADCKKEPAFKDSYSLNG